MLVAGTSEEESHPGYDQVLVGQVYRHSNAHEIIWSGNVEALTERVLRAVLGFFLLPPISFSLVLIP